MVVSVRILAFFNPTALRINRIREREAGFTLLEVLVALGILGMSLTVLLGVFTMALDRTRASQTRAVAEHLAHTLLLQAEKIDPSELIDKHGTADPGFAWSIKTTPYGTTEDRNAWQDKPTRILVNVQWKDHGRDRVISLSTLRIVPEGKRD